MLSLACAALTAWETRDLAQVYSGGTKRARWAVDVAGFVSASWDRVSRTGKGRCGCAKSGRAPRSTEALHGFDSEIRTANARMRLRLPKQRIARSTGSWLPVCAAHPHAGGAEPRGPAAMVA